ncbi:hypothetical protein O181_097426 [Austropuccinia psidii MF-1]|uniref:Uncharacterized protein n=1 Tax=Austropuccinia psidii MF-1 TaxID=1389203 RepID=A0A9Q3J8Z3_9BASI|nr:hypothetical protein [Austropuccinia psidii MF-1]
MFSTRHVIFFENDFPCPNSMPKTKENKLFFSDVERLQSNDDTFFDCQEHLTVEAPSDLNDEVTSQANDLSVESSSNDQDSTGPTTRINLIGPRHPTLISSDIQKENILPYPRRPRALLTSLKGSSLIQTSPELRKCQPMDRSHQQGVRNNEVLRRMGSCAHHHRHQTHWHNLGLQNKVQ